MQAGASRGRCRPAACKAHGKDHLSAVARSSARRDGICRCLAWPACAGAAPGGRAPSVSDRKSVVSGKSVSVRVDLGGRRIHKKTKKAPKTPKQHASQKLYISIKKYIRMVNHIYIHIT